MIRKHFTVLASDVQESNQTTVQFGAERAFNAQWSDVVNGYKGLKESSGQKKLRFMAGLDRKAYQAAEGEAAKILQRIENPQTKLAADAQRAAIITEVAASEGYARWFEKMFFWHRPRAVFLNAMSTGLNIGLSQAARKCQVPVYLVSHCSVGEGPLSFPLHREALRNFTEDLCASPHADIQVIQSPHAEAASIIAAPAAKRLRVQPIIWGTSRIEVRSRSEHDEFVILHAGNFQPWEYYDAFSSESSLEYVRGIRQLAEVIAKMPNSRLIIRIKPGHEHKAECLAESVKAQLPDGLNYRISVEGSFSDELSAADLLISSTSTVIEEALQNRVPVLLHSGSRIKPFLPSRTSLPTLTDRAAVYAVEDPAHLPDMLNAIATAHFQKPLTAVETRPHCFGSDVLSRKDFARLLTQSQTGELPGRN